MGKQVHFGVRPIHCHSAISCGGFTLFEAVVSLGIFAILTSVILLRYSQFQGSILLTNLAYDVALSIRQAQVFGVSVRGYSGPGCADPACFNAGYGIHFDISDASMGSNKSYIFFADIDGVPPDGAYDPVLDALINEYKLKGGNRISKICVKQGAADICGTEATPDPLSVLDIAFLRPDPEAKIRATDSSNGVISGAGTASVYIQSTNGSERIVKVETTGQISITKP